MDWTGLFSVDKGQSVTTPPLPPQVPPSPSHFQPIVDFAKGFWQGTKDLTNQGVDLYIRHFSENVASPALQAHKKYLENLTGSPEINTFLSELCQGYGPSLFKKLLDDPQKSNLGSLFSRNQEAALKILEGNIFQAVVNLVDAAKAKAAAQKQPFPTAIEPLDFLVKVATILAELEQDQVKQVADEVASAEKSGKAKMEIFKGVDEKILKIAFPKGAAGLLLPDIPYFHALRPFIFSKMKQLLPKGQNFFNLWVFTGESLSKNIESLKQRPGGDLFVENLRKIALQSGLFVNESLKLIGEDTPLEPEDGMSYTLQQFIEKQQAHFPTSPIKKWLQNLLKKSGDQAAVKKVLGHFDQFAFSFAVHIFSSLASKNPDKTKTVLAAATETLVDALLNKSADELLSNLGLDSQPLSSLLPFDDETMASLFFKEKAPESKKGKKVPFLLKEKVQKLCSEFSEIKKGPSNDLGPRLCDYEQGREKLKGLFVKGLERTKTELQDEKTALKLQNKVVNWLNKQLYIGALTTDKNWLATSFKELSESEIFSKLKPLIENYVVDIGTDLCAHLALNNPDFAHQAKIKMYPAALSHIAKIARDSLKEVNLPQKMAFLRDLPEGFEKEAQKRRLFGPLVSQILSQGGWDLEEKIRLPKMLKGFIKRQLIKSLLPNLCYTALELWMRETEGTQKALIEQTTDGGALLKQIKIVAEHFPPLDLAPKDLAFSPLLHFVGHLVKLEPAKKALLPQLVNQLLTPLMEFKGHMGREEFRPLVAKVLAKMGADEKGLDKLLAFFSESVAESLEKSALDFCVDFYEKVLAVRGQPKSLPKDVEGIEEGRHFIQGIVEDLMPKIREALVDEENGGELQDILADTINRYLGEKRISFEKNWLHQTFKEFFDTKNEESVSFVQTFVQSYLIDSLTDLFIHLAASHPKPGKKGMVESSIDHLLGLLDEVKDPYLTFKLQKWMALPDATEAQAWAKEDAKIDLRKELFASVSEEILKKGGWDNPANIRAPAWLRPHLKKWMAERILPEQLLRICCDMLVPKNFTAVDKRRIEKMGGLKQLDSACEGLAETGIFKIFKMISEKSSSLSEILNEHCANARLDLTEEASLGNKIAQLFSVGTKPLGRFSERCLAESLKYGFAQLALNYKGHTEGDIMHRIGLYIRDLFKECFLDPRLVEMIRIYHEQTRSLKEILEAIGKLKQQAAHELNSGKVSSATQEELERLAQKKTEEIKELEEKYKISETLRNQQMAFEPKVQQLLKDMGFASAQDLPVPYFFKKTLWHRLTTQHLPNLCLTAAEQMIAAFDELVPAKREVAALERAFKERHEASLPVGEKLPEEAKAPLVRGIDRWADHLVKLLESKIALHGSSGLLKALDNAIMPHLVSGEKGQKAVLEIIQPNRKEIAQWLGQESPQLALNIKDQMGKSLKEMVAAPLLKGAYNIIEHLEEVERNHPERLFDFFFEVVPDVTTHFKTALKIAEKYGKAHIHEVDPLIMLREFEAHKLLHPAMPEYETSRVLKETEVYIKQLEEELKNYQPGSHAQWYLRVDKLKVLKNIPHLKYGPEYFLREAVESSKILREELERKAKANFYNDFSKSILEMAGLKGPEDLKIGQPFWNLWGITPEEGWAEVSKAASWILQEATREAFSPSQLNSYMAKILITLNETLKRKRAKGEYTTPPLRRLKEIDPKVTAMQQRCNEMFDQLRKILPKSMVTEMTEVPLIDQIPGKVLAEALRETLQQNPLSKIFEMGLIQAVEKLPEKLPFSFEELAQQQKMRAAENLKNIETVTEEGEKTLPLLIEKMEHNFFSWWERIQAAFQAWVQKTLGPGGVKAKEVFDKIFHTVFISLIMAPAYRIARWLLFAAIQTYAKLKSATNLEVGRASIVDTAINANLLFLIGDRFRKMYA